MHIPVCWLTKPRATFILPVSAVLLVTLEKLKLVLNAGRTFFPSCNLYIKEGRLPEVNEEEFLFWELTEKYAVSERGLESGDKGGGGV